MTSFLFYTEIMETNLILAALNVAVFVLVDFWFTKEFAGRFADLFFIYSPRVISIYLEFFWGSNGG